MPEPLVATLPAAIVTFALSAVMIMLAGARIARISDALADVTRWGEAMFGALVLGAGTSIPGIVTSVSAAADGRPELAFSNAAGGIAAQTAFLAIADVFHRRANLEHAAASVPNMLQSGLLVVLLGLVLLVMTGPDVTIASVHVGSLALLVVYALGLRMIRSAWRWPAWRAEHTPDTVEDRVEPERGGQTAAQLWRRFALLAAVLAVAGHAVARSGAAIADRTGIDDGFFGAVFTAIATSLPELVTAIAAVRCGALTLAVGNIIGGNSFDVLFLSFADLAYRDGSLYHAVSAPQMFAVALPIVLTGVLLLGLLRRERRGFANIGFESGLILFGYLAGVGLLYLAQGTGVA